MKDNPLQTQYSWTANEFLFLTKLKIGLEMDDIVISNCPGNVMTSVQVQVIQGTLRYCDAIAAEELPPVPPRVFQKRDAGKLCSIDYRKFNVN